MLTRDGERCDVLYRNKSGESLWLPVRNSDGDISHQSVEVKPGDTFYPTPDMNLKALIKSVLVGKVAKQPTPEKEL